jgi:beta-lactamase class A
MIALFKEAEADPGLLQKKILYDGSFDYNTAQNFKPEKTLTPHQSYTLNELNERMIAYSDNNAVPLLSHYIDDHKLRTVFSDLGVFIPTTSGELNQDFISVKAYANFFRVLYNASYLNRDLSEKALSVLSKSDFPQGITAGVPTSTIIVQKFGERKILDINNNPISTELHDCGIIYAPAHPYLLCIMTKGKNFNELAGSIKDISKLVYDSVQNGI